MAGHKNKDLPDDPAILQQTRDYLLNARWLLAEKLSPREYFDEMIALYPDRLNVGPVWYTAVALLPEPLATPRSVTRSTHWFFDDYLATWIGVGAGTIKRGPEFILDYWSAPLHWSDDTRSIGGFWMDRPWWASSSDLHSRLRDEGYAHTAVPDQTVRVYHDNGAAIEVIWSRQRADGTEIERGGRAFRGGARVPRMAHPRHPGRTDRQRLAQQPYGRKQFDRNNQPSKGDNNDHRHRRP